MANTWIKTINGASTDDSVESVFVDSSGNIYFSGFSNINSNNTAFVAKFDSGGTLIWDKAIGDNTGNLVEQSVLVTVDSSGNVYTAFNEASTQGGTTRFNFTKLNSSGVHQWSRQVNDWQGSNNSFADTITGIATDSSGNLYLTGQSIERSYIAKFDTSGTFVWNRRIDAGNVSNPNVDTLDIYYNGTSFFLSGINTNWYGGGGSSGGTDLHVLRYDTSGNRTRLASARYDATRTQSLSGDRVSVDTSGNIYVLDRDRKLVVKFNSAGTIQWTRIITGGSLILQDLDCQGTDIYLVGSDSNNGVIIKLDTSGAIVYQNGLDHSTLNFSLTEIVTDSEYFYIGGNTTNSDRDFVLIKLKLDGSGLGTFGSYTYSTITTYSTSNPGYAAGSTPSGSNTAIDPLTNGSTTARTVADVTVTITTTNAPITHLASAALASTATVSATGRRLVQNWDVYTWDSLDTWDNWPYDDWDKPNWRPSVAFTVTAAGTATRFVTGSADLTASASLTATASFLLSGSADLTVTATLTAAVGQQLTGVSALTSTATVTAQGRIGKTASIFVDGFATVAVQAQLAKTGVAILESQSELTAFARRLRTGTADLSSAFTFENTGFTNTVPGQAQLNSEFTLSADADVGRFGQANLLSLFTLSSQAKILKFAQANITAFASTVTVGRIYNLDPYTTYRIEPETRLFKISQESRLLNIDAETRLFQVSEETRTYSVEQDSQELTIQGYPQ
jgi:hypothetical protein